MNAHNPIARTSRPLSDLSGADRRTLERRLVDGNTTLRGADRMPIAIQVTSLSEIGIGFVSAHSFEVGSEISIGLAGSGTFGARIVRRHGGDYGAEFFECPTAEDVACAFTTANVVSLEIVRLPVAEEPVRWHRQTRGWVLVGLTMICWVAIIAAVKAFG